MSRKVKSILVIFLFAITLRFMNKTITYENEISILTDNFTSQCEKEWVKVNDKIFFRRKLSFCYTDLKKIRIYFTKHKKYKINLKFEIMSNHKSLILKMTEIHFPHLDFKNYRVPYQHGYLEADLDCLKMINSDHKDANLKINIFSSLFKTKIPINLETKIYNQEDALKNGSIICSKVFSFGDSRVKSFEWWIETSKISGYEKIVIFNNSLSEIYGKLFDRHNDFVQVIQYQCIPNLFTHLYDKSYFKFHELDKLFPTFRSRDKDAIYRHYEYTSNNECYLLNKEKYKFIAVFDNDEYILPRFNNIFNIIKFKEPNKMVERHNCYKINQFTPKLELYLQYINNDLNLTQKNTYFFQMNCQLKMQTMKIVFKELGKILDNYEIKINSINEQFDFLINIKDLKDTDSLEFVQFGHKPYLDFNLTINNKEDFIYAKYLYDSYINLIEPFLEKNKFNLENVEETINRFYFILGDNLSYRNEMKTVHDTLKTTDLNWHLPNNAYSSKVKVPNRLGHTSHFRLKYNTFWKTYPIKSLFFDFDYFTCYYLKILKNLNYIN